MIKSKKVLKEVYWLLPILMASYLFISIKSSFKLSDPFHVCHGASIVFSNLLVVIQLTFLIFITRQLFNYIMQMEDEKWRLRLLPIVVFAFPISVIVIWYQYMGC